MKRESGIAAATIQKLETQIAYLLDEISGLKAELKVIQDDVKDLLLLCMEAKSSANAAHDRLDALGVSSASKSRDENKNPGKKQ